MTKKKQKSYVIVAKEGSQHTFGHFYRNKEGRLAAKEFLKKIQKEHTEKLFIEKR